MLQTPQNPPIPLHTIIYPSFQLHTLLFFFPPHSFTPHFVHPALPLATYLISCHPPPPPTLFILPPHHLQSLPPPRLTLHLYLICTGHLLHPLNLFHSALQVGAPLLSSALLCPNLLDPPYSPRLSLIHFKLLDTPTHLLFTLLYHGKLFCSVFTLCSYLLFSFSFPSSVSNHLFPCVLQTHHYSAL